MSRSKKKLSIVSETLRTLSSATLAGVNGGGLTELETITTPQTQKCTLTICPECRSKP